MSDQENQEKSQGHEEIQLTPEQWAAFNRATESLATNNAEGTSVVLDDDDVFGDDARRQPTTQKPSSAETSSESTVAKSRKSSSLIEEMAIEFNRRLVSDQ